MARRPGDSLPPSLSDSGFFVLRTPLLPFDELVRWGEGLTARPSWSAGCEPGRLEAAWSADVELLRRRLREVLERPEVAHALYVASPSLQPGIEHWKRDPDSKKGLQAERSLVRYFTRMSARCTPFGLFSGCSVGRMDAEGGATALVLEPRPRYRTCSRLDFDYVFALTKALQSDPALAEELRYWPNSSLRRIGNAWHYIESRLAGTQRSHHLVKLEDDAYLAAALRRAEGGAKVAELVETVLAQDADDPPAREEARDFVLELVHNDVLVPSLAPLVTGEPPLDDIIRQTRSLPSGERIAATLERVRAGMAALDAKGLGCSPADYETVAEELTGLPAKADIARLYQVDMIKPVAEARLGQAVLDELTASVALLSRLGQAGEPNELRSFREAFSQRYERAMVPLLEALDEETGVGFGRPPSGDSPLLRGLQLGGRGGGVHSFDLQGLLLRKVVPRTTAVETEITLDPSDLPSDPTASRRLPSAFCFSFTLIAPSTTAVEKGDFRLLFDGAAGPSGARLFGRFCHADPELERWVRSHLRQEEGLDPEALHAEVVYLPEGRIGNVLCRPVLRDYEIPYLGRSGAPPDRQLPVSDLLVGIEDGRLVLYSRRLGRRIVPRLTNAHGFMNPQLASVYRFLCNLQHQEGGSIPGLSWGGLETLDFLPRVRIGRVVLSLARWRLSKEDIDALTKPAKAARFLAMQELRERRGLPRWVVFEEGDHTLPTDLDNPLSVDALVHVLKRGSAALLTEMYPKPDELCVTSVEGRFCHELNVPMVLRAPAEKSPAAGPRAGGGATVALASARIARNARALPPGGEWLYLKLYGGGATLDEVLTTALPPVTEAARARGAVSRWFFVRYTDPHEHLRIRLNGPPDQLTREVLPLVAKAFNPLLASGRLWKIQLDTYEREIERYGGAEAARAAEDVFFADSEAVLEILRGSPGDEGMDLRWRVGLRGVDRLLSDCGLDVEARRTAVGRWRDDYQREFQTSGEVKKQLGDKFRAERRSLEALFWNAPEPGTALERAWQALDRRSGRIAEAVRLLQSLAAAGELPLEIPELAASYAHMHINRLIRSSARQHELVLYDFLFRLYDGKIATRKRAQPGAAETAPQSEEPPDRRVS